MTANESDSVASIGNFSLPQHWTRTSSMHTWEFENTKSKNNRYRSFRFRVSSRNTHKPLFDMALTVEEQIGLFSVLSRFRVLDTDGNGLSINREGRSLIVDVPKEGSRGGSDKSTALVLLATAKPDPTCILNLKRTECIVLSGIVLSCLSENLGVTDESARFLIQQWRQS